MIDNRAIAKIAAINRFRELEDSGSSYPDALSGALALAQVIAQGIDTEALRAEIEADLSVVAHEARVLVDPTGHTPWLTPERKDATAWKFWDRYRNYLAIERGFPTKVINRLDVDTDALLGYLEDPTIADRDFDTRGLVMGNVQSGKTTNYSALINKAIDAGYKLIVVLAGLHNNLRSQTQMRLDAEVLGFDTAVTMVGQNVAVPLGVMKIPGAVYLPVHSLTSRKERGDFSTNVAQQAMVQPGGDPILLVIKKNETVLRNLVRYYRDLCPASVHDPKAGRRIIRNVPVLVIDDEADQASVNTKIIPLNDDGLPNPSEDPSKINRRIREFMHCFSQSAYIGYTATPYANIFIHHEAVHREYGEDLFPRSFIVSLTAPSNYLGPQQLLGGSDPDDHGQPVLRNADDGKVEFPDGHKQTHTPSELPASLKTALLSFVLSSAMRRARGYVPVHNSMLIHVTRYQAVQARVAELVGDELANLRNRLRFGDGAGLGLLDELRALHEQDYVPTSGSMGRPVVAWSDLEPHLAGVIGSLKIRVINGSSDDLLDYDAPLTENSHIIAIGGDKLSRGLTLEGLTVSYFLRSSKMYDTLMQMGRWFGYRPGYEDLCRIYAPADLTQFFRDIAVADEELRTEFDHMARIGATPRDYGLRVRSHPVLLITSQVKMRHGFRLNIDYQGSIIETTSFPRDNDLITHNLDLTDAFVTRLGPPRVAGSGATELWERRTATEVCQFLRGYRTSDSAPRANSIRLAEYIEGRQALAVPELGQWSVALVSRTPGPNVATVTLGGRQVACLDRQFTSARPTNFSIKRLLSPSDELLDFTDPAEAARVAAELGKPTIKDAKVDDVHRHRPPSRGLLLIYPVNSGYLFGNDATDGDHGQRRRDHLARGIDLTPPTATLIGIGVVFPGSKHGAAVEYMVNTVYAQGELEL